MKKVVYVFGLLLSLALATACAPKQGDRGPTGYQGQNGNSPIVTQLPATLTECPTGGTDISVTSGADISVTKVFSICNGIAGSNGLNGLNGLDGAVGATGPQGAAGTQLRIVQFCPETPTYPSTFPEIGIVIGTTVFGVYSANDGFLAELPPGQYASNGIGSACTFTINADGTISN